MSSLYKSLLVAMLLVSSIASAEAATRGMSYSYGGHYHGWRQDPQLNNYLSARYDHLLQTNLRFRHYRMWKECHTITWPGLRGHCLASFDEYTPVLARAWR